MISRIKNYKLLYFCCAFFAIFTVYLMILEHFCIFLTRNDQFNLRTLFEKKSYFVNIYQNVK